MSNKWSTYEANVQSYRSNMIASQSFLLAASMFSIDRTVLGCACVTIALFQLWFIWFRIIRVRTIISDYHKFDLGNKFYDCGQEIVEATEHSKKPLDEDTYVKNRGVRKKVNEALSKDKPKLKHNMRHTRVKLDLILPISFTLLWIIIFLYSIKVII